MTVAELLTEVVVFIIGDGDTIDGLLGDNYLTIVMAAVVSGLAISQLPRLFKRSR